MRYYIFGCTDAGSGREFNKETVLIGGRVFNEGSGELACEAPFSAAFSRGEGSAEELKKIAAGGEGSAAAVIRVDEDGTGTVSNSGAALYRYVNGRAELIRGDFAIDGELGAEPDDMLIVSDGYFADYVSIKDIERAMGLDLPISEKLNALSRVAAINGCREDLTVLGVKPFLDDEELEALTAYSIMEQRVNVSDMLKESDPLSDILDIDVQEIIGKKKKPEPVKKAVPEKIDSMELEFHDLFMQAQASLSKLENLFKDKK
ncbi:MAG: hypothetical protein IJ806_04360 [Ruminococcus sp.]|nr:hypothetical protein [Ruminococcus sp.]